MVVARALTRTGILTTGLGDVFEGGSKWLFLLLGIAGLIALIEAATMANLLLLGYVVLEQDFSGPLNGIFGDGILAGYSQPRLLVVLGSALAALVSLRFAVFLTYRYLALNPHSVVH